MDRRIPWIAMGAVVLFAIVWLTTGNWEDAVPVGAHVVDNAAEVSATSATADGVAASTSPTEAGSLGKPVAAAPLSSSSGRPASTPPSAGDGPHPIDVAPGFEYLNPDPGKLKDTDPRYSSIRRHQKLQEESRDPVWSERMETALRAAIEGALTAKGFDTHRIEMPVVECRSTGCEIQAFGYAEDNGKEADLQQIMFKMLAGTSGDEFDKDGFTMSLDGGTVASPPGRISFLVQLPRKTS